MGKGKIHWHVYAGGGAILLFGVLLLFRLGVPGKLVSGGPEKVSPVQAEMPLGESWMNITQAGKKIGYAQRIYAKTAEGFSFTENIFMRINTMGIVQPLTVRTAAELKPDRTLASFRFDLGSSLYTFTAKGAVEGKKLTVLIGEPGKEQVSEIPLSAQPYMGGGILESVGAQGLKVGEGRSYPVFDPASLGQRPVQVTFLAEEPLTVMGRSQQARKVSVDFMGMKQTAWVSREGSVLREEGIMGIVLEKVTRKEALSALEGAVSADLTQIASIAASEKIDHAEALTGLKVRLEGVGRRAYMLDGGRQRYREGILTIRREQSGGEPESPVPDAGELAAALKATPFIQSDHARIRQQAAAIVGPADADGIKARKLLDWVYRNLEKRPVLSVPDALETLERRVGDCNEHAVLLAALARAAGLPTEVEAGLVHLRGRFFYHAWNVIYLRDSGGWVTADAVLDQMPADVTHIRFVRGQADRQLDLAGLIGTLKLEILEMRR